MENFFEQLISGNSFVSALIFLFFRVLAIVIPPIPGGVVDLAGIAAFGKFKGFILGEIGILLGGCIAFLVARWFREPLIKKFTSLAKVHELEANISERKKFWGLVAIRLFTSSIFDYLSYAAGLTKISFTKYFLSTLIGTIPGVFIFYYIGGTIFEFSKWLMIVLIFLTLFIPLLLKKSHLRSKFYKAIGLKL